jgi:hypothetical protein
MHYNITINIINPNRHLRRVHEMNKNLYLEVHLDNFSQTYKIISYTVEKTPPNVQIFIKTPYQMHYSESRWKIPLY